MYEQLKASTRNIRRLSQGCATNIAQGFSDCNGKLNDAIERERMAGWAAVSERVGDSAHLLYSIHAFDEMSEVEISGIGPMGEGAIDTISGFIWEAEGHYGW